MFIKDNSAWINIEIACEILEVNRSAYYEWLSNLNKRLAKTKLEEGFILTVINAFLACKKRYGARRLAQKLNKDGLNCSENKVAAIMKANNLIPLTHKKYKVKTTNSNHNLKVFDNLLNRNFTIDEPNKAYVGDITYIRTNEGWLYLATILDLFSRKIIGYSMSNRMTKDLVISALQKAIKARGYPKGVIVHSDRGSQYASNAYKELLSSHGLLGSMSKKGDCYDNAVAESSFATLKKEYVYHVIFNTRLEAQLGIFDYIEAWYNKERIHSTLNGLSPNEFEALNRHKFLSTYREINNINNDIIANSNCQIGAL
jgi:transposase InsO family protein